MNPTDRLNFGKSYRPDVIRAPVLVFFFREQGPRNKINNIPFYRNQSAKEQFPFIRWTPASASDNSASGNCTARNRLTFKVRYYLEEGKSPFRDDRLIDGAKNEVIGHDAG